jgi:hypothetical protein
MGNTGLASLRLLLEKSRTTASKKYLPLQGKRKKPRRKNSLLCFDAWRMVRGAWSTKKEHINSLLHARQSLGEGGCQLRAG